MSSHKRLYVDESGDHGYKQLDSPDKRYLGLVGCWFDLQSYRENFQARFEALKQKYFPHDPDEPVVLHRKELLNKDGIFRVLLDPDKEASFNEELLSLIQESQFTVIAVVIDKRAHRDRYGEAAWHPYHYCLMAILERYCGYLNFTNQRGDVLAESRGGTEDHQLKQAYKRIYESGTWYRPGAWFQKVLTSHELKLKPKSKNIAGLQLADIIAHPVKQEILAEKGKIPAQEGAFGRQICSRLKGKYNREVFKGQTWGYGKILLD